MDSNWVGSQPGTSTELGSRRAPSAAKPCPARVRAGAACPHSSVWRCLCCAPISPGTCGRVSTWRAFLLLVVFLDLVAECVELNQKAKPSTVWRCRLLLGPAAYTPSRSHTRLLALGGFRLNGGRVCCWAASEVKHLSLCLAPLAGGLWDVSTYIRGPC